MMIITETTLMDLLRDETDPLGDLSSLYGEIPTTACTRRASCCRMLPDATLLEVVAALKRLSRLSSEERLTVLRQIIHYFFVNPVEMTACPFLSGQDCLIYEDRFFGCRAYGLWSITHYDRIASQDRDARGYLQAQWEKLGITLPDTVISFRQPYCRDVNIVGSEPFDDRALESVSNRIESLSSDFSPWHDLQHTYFSDVSFLIASLAMGIAEAIQAKFDIVKAMLLQGDRTRLDRVMSDFPDILTPEEPVRSRR